MGVTAELCDKIVATTFETLTPDAVMPHAGVEAWWKCANGDDHEWRTTIDSRASKAGLTSCPFCANRRLSTTNSLATRYPGVAAHLQACGPCGEDFEGLLATIHDEAPQP